MSRRRWDWVTSLSGCANTTEYVRREPGAGAVRRRVGRAPRRSRGRRDAGAEPERRGGAPAGPASRSAWKPRVLLTQDVDKNVAHVGTVNMLTEQNRSQLHFYFLSPLAAHAPRFASFIRISLFEGPLLHHRRKCSEVLHVD